MLKRIKTPPERHDTNPFSIDLVTSSNLVLDFLTDAQKLPGFESLATIESLMKQYLCFLFVQEENPNEELIPSKPIQAIWFSHMLQSCAYKSFADNFVTIWKSNHPLTRILDPAVRSDLESRTEKLIAEKYPKECENASFLEYWGALVSEFTPAMIIDDRDWILEFNKFTSGTDVKSVEFREKAVFGYRRLIYMKFVDSGKVEEVGMSPCPSVDLVWHTHLVHPSMYAKDMGEMLGHVPMHKLLDVKDRTEAWMDARDDQSMKMWEQQYGESIFVYAVV